MKFRDVGHQGKGVLKLITELLKAQTQDISGVH